MASTIPVAFVNSYRSNVTMLYQQKASVLRDVGRVEAPTGEAHFFERLAPHDMLQRTARHSEQDVQDADHTRRMVIMNEWYTNQYIDKEDKLRMLIDPQGPYTMNASAAAGRKIDSVVYSAIRGNAYSGHAGATPVALPSGQKIAHGGAGLTKAKVLEAHRKLTFSEVPQDGRYFIYNAFGFEQTGLGNHPSFVKFVAKIGRELSEHGSTDAATTNIMTAAEAQKKIHEILNDKTDVYHSRMGTPGRKERIDEVLDLHRIISGEA